MAESQSILQLGIEAAREGRREEARGLFSLLTRQEPDNVQAWLWLAGVAESPEERRAALERVVELEPSNQMAVKGLQAMGVGGAASSVAPNSVEVPPVVEPARPLSDEERYAAELDAAYDDYDIVDKEGPALRNDPTPLHSSAYDDDLPTSGATARERVENRRNTMRADYDDDDNGVVNRRRGPSRLLLLLLAAVLLVFIGIIVFSQLGDDTPVAGNGETDAAQTQTAEAVAAADEPTPDTSDEPVPPTDGETPPAEGEVPPVDDAQPPADGEAPPAEGEVPPTEGEQPPADGEAPPANGQPDLAGAQPAPVDIGAVLETGGWNYTFPGGCIGSCAVPVGPQIGGFTAQGNYVIVLTQLANNTGNEQPIPADFFVLRDGQGNIYEPQPQVSTAYTIPGVNADRSMEAPVPANGILTSVPLVFDVPSGATDLVLFARGNTAQGWPVLNAVP